MRVLEREEQTLLRPLVGFHLGHVLAVEEHLPPGDLVGRVAHERVGERRLAGAVRPHDRVHLVLAHGQVDTLDDLGAVLQGHVQVGDLELSQNVPYRRGWHAADRPRALWRHGSSGLPTSGESKRLHDTFAEPPRTPRNRGQMRLGKLLARCDSPGVGHGARSPRCYAGFVPGSIGWQGLIVILLVLLVVFGPKRLPELGRSLGRGMREFKDSVTGDSRGRQDDDDSEPLMLEHEIGRSPEPDAHTGETRQRDTVP